MQSGETFSSAKATALRDLAADSSFNAAFDAAAARAPLAFASAPDVFGSRVKKNRNAVVTNGRTVHAHAVRGIESHDFALFENVAWSGLQQHAHLLPSNEDDACAATMLIQSIVGQELAQRIVRSSTIEMPDSPAVSRFGNLSSHASLQVVMDPLSADAQRIIPILAAAAGLPVAITLILNPTTELANVPLKAFFRYVWNVTPSFDSTGNIDVPLAVFSALPSDNVLTLAVHPPDSWMVSSSSAPVDLDNIRLSDLGSSSTLAAEYTVDKLVITGHCIDENYRPPQGLQLDLDTPDGSKHVHDTLVMSNLGHFQLQALPGAYSLSLADGRSKELYDIMQRRSHVTSLPVQVDNINSQPVHLHVHKKPDKMNLDLLHREEAGNKGAAAEKSAGIWGSIMGAFGGQDAPAAKALDLSVRGEETIHVFSLATGHLYERFLKIMMLAVTRNTNAPVKFWLLGNFVSPQFKRSLPLLAKHWGYTYEFVTYKWPSWLNRQTEKQRIIWAYKVLFLDVLFPLHVKKIIYIDSDQVVRADLRELWHMDLKGAPLAYTPFCDSNKDIEGFRFWKTGFWKSHLQGRNYHISALYVVDLERFRQLAAGDSWRIIYDQLSRDPNSLSNLDQDLPNYSQQQAIYIYFYSPAQLPSANASAGAHISSCAGQDLQLAAGVAVVRAAFEIPPLASCSPVSF
jgi:UDP-glucose:glycoprotein glucosyltransferase